MKAIKRTDTQTGEVRVLHSPESQVDSRLRQLRARAAPHIRYEVEDDRPVQFVSPDEQRAAHSAIEQERHQPKWCPDCGGEMEYDGSHYCERCEG